MKLKFKGEDGSMHLKTGQVYEVEIRTIRQYIVLFIKHPVFGCIKCPYGSPGTFERNWKLP